MARFKLNALSHVELSHLLFSEAHRPCLEAFRSQIRGFLISTWDTCRSQRSFPVIEDEVASVLTMSMCSWLLHLCLPSLLAHSFIYVCLFRAQSMGAKREILVSRGKLLKRLEPSTPSWSHFPFHVSSCPSPKWPITIISLLVVLVVMVAR